MHLFYSPKKLFQKIFIKTFCKNICFLGLETLLCLSQSARGPKNKLPFLGHQGQLHGLFKAAHACTNLLYLSCKLYSKIYLFISLLKKIFHKIWAFWSAVYKIQSCTPLHFLYCPSKTTNKQIGAL